MHVAQIGFFLDRQARAPRQLLVDWYSLAYIADAVASSGTRVSVIQACHEDLTMRHGEADYFFLRAQRGRSIAASARFLRLLDVLRPDVFHVHGLAFAEDVRALRAAAPGIPILLQDHADRVPRFWRRPRMRRGLSFADGVSFCSRRQADPFRAAALLPPQSTVFEISESSSVFSCGDRDAARASCGISGDPAVLWVGHLDDNKDPLTVLEAIAAAARSSPGLRLWCVFATAPLLAAVRRRIDGDARLRERVTLLGRVPHAHIETLMRAADLFVLGSHREGSGYSLIEALSCGLLPAVTDIPSFRTLTAQGSIGRLWPSGDARACCEALLELAAQQRLPARAAVRAHFDANVSFTAIGTRFAAAYAELAGRRAHGG